MFEILGMYASYSLPFVLNKGALSYVQPLFLASSRMLIAGPLLLLYVYFFKRADFKFSPKHIPLLFTGIIAQSYLGYTLCFWAFQFLTANKNALLFSFTPFITSIICYIFYGEKLTTKKIIGLIIAFAGSLPLLMNHPGNEDAVGDLLFISWPEIVCFLGVIGFAYGWIVFGALTKDYHYSPCMINGLSMLIGGAMLLATSPFIDCWNPLPYTHLPIFLSYTIALVLISNFLAFNWYVSLLKKYSASTIAFFSFTEPLYVAVYSYLWLGEVITWHFFVAFIAIFIGLYLFYQKEL